MNDIAKLNNMEEKNDRSLRRVHLPVLSMERY